MVDRRAIILEGVTKTGVGLEIAPWFAPIAPRREGYNVRILDVFDRETLQKRGAADMQQNWRDMSLLDEVDYVGSATEVASLVPTELHGTFDYIVSSHNFEHLPNPIKFLQGCASLLKPGGLITMAVPDHRACFDYFRPHTVIGDWLEAYFEDRSRPKPKQVFDARSTFSVLRGVGEMNYAFYVGAPPSDVEITGDLGAQFAAWRDGTHGDDYQDAHCTVMSPASLEMLLLEARALGVLPLDVESISGPSGCEFFVRLRKPVAGITPLTPQDVAVQRTAIAKRIFQDYAAQTRPDPALRRRQFARKLRGLSRRLRGKAPK